MQHAKKRKLRQLRRWRIRKKVSGTGDRPRMSVHFSNEHIYVQFIDDAKGITLASASTRDKSTPGREQLAANVQSAKKVGTSSGVYVGGDAVLMNKIACTAVDIHCLLSMIRVPYYMYTV